MKTSLFLTVLYLLYVARAQITFDVQEEQQPPVVLGNIANRANITSVPDLDFSLPSHKDLFEVDASTGEFRTKTVLDRETLCGSVPRCVISTSVAVSSPQNFFQRYTVNVTVVDANDQRPDFRITSFPKSLSERAAINATIQLPVAYDGDYEPLFKVQNYYLEPESQNTFDLVVQRHNRTDGYVDFDLYLRLKKKLDREETDSYSMTLVASDGGSPSNNGRLPIIISVTDENDNEPVFQRNLYEKSVDEVTPVGTTLLSVFATDADDGENGRVGYEFPNNIDRNVLEYFEIDRASGGVKLVKTLEKEGGTTFKFKVKAQDHGTPAMTSEVSVQITVEDTVNDPPSITIRPWRSSGDSALVSEDAVVDKKVALIDVTDTDSGSNGETKCSASSDYFTMQEYTNSGGYTISVAKTLDRERDRTHLITIMCVDQGSPPLSSTATLTVVVEDVNDNKPMFTKRIYQMKVKENQEKGELVGNVFATDADDGVNAILRYSLEPSAVQFEINESNGFIYTSVKNLDREKRDKYTFEVYAFDTSTSPLTSTATVVVNIEDLNDVWPLFDNSSYTFRISENAESDTVVGRVHATDRDLGLGGVVEYLLVHSPLHPDPPFKMSQADGKITLTDSLDYETTKAYNFVVTAIDLGQPPRNSSVEVVIEVLDENDNPPIIAFPSPDNLSVTLNLDVAPGHEVIKVIAHDYDSGENGRLSYSLTAPNSSSNSLFWINEDTGLVTLVSPLTPADVRTYNIVISVNDHGAQQRATQALLQIEVVQQAEEKRSKESYTTIVIIMVCVTLFVAVIVLVTLCFIKYIDRRKYEASPGDKYASQPKFEPVTKTTAREDEYIHQGSGDDTLERGLVVSPSVQKQPLAYQIQHQRNGSHLKNGKKSVTFDSAVRTSDTSMATTESISTQPDSGFGSMGSTFNPNPTPYNPSNLTTTFNPGSTDSYNTNGSIKFLPSSSSSPNTFSQSPVPFFYNTSSNSRTNSGHAGSSHDYDGGVASTNSMGRVAEELEAGDEVIDVALQKHNALVRSMRGNSRRPPYASRQPRPASGNHDTEVCSSSSVETSDSGHGGSELDVSMIKANV